MGNKTKLLECKALLMTALVSAGFAGFLVPSAAQAADKAKTHHASIDCDKPEKKDVNFSWADGISSVTVYYNNHCSHDVKATLKIMDTHTGSYIEECLTTKAGEKSHKKFDVGVIERLKEIEEGC